jgi:putative transcriptional regulator
VSYIYDKEGDYMVNEKLKQARLDKSLSQGELANLIGVSRQTINMIENNDYNPSLALCLKICKALDKTLDELFWR